ncbi:MAG: alpha/beta hydrolase [Labilithrix sp.]|nr:alpha/beta hydrolase [Labilithrix sp.]MCW5813204.1 alpha/beta hydrolase [Labilithrix sp.]
MTLCAVLAGCGVVSDGERTRLDRSSPEKDGRAASGDAPRAPAEEPLPASSGRIRIHYPAGGATIALAADGGGDLGALTAVEDDVWELTLEDVREPVAFRPTRDGSPAKGPPYVVEPGQSVEVYPWFDHETGTLAGFADAFASRVLKNTHGVRMYTPPSYRENTAKRYPVIYMHDGQIIFERNMAPLEDSLAKASFGSFKTETTMNAEIAAGRIPEAIVIGIDLNIVLDPRDPIPDRVKEYSPTPDDAFAETTGTGQGPQYLRMIVDELRPVVNERLRTLADREHTFMLGSSLGGLISVWAGLFEGDTFGAVAGLSIATYWDKEVVVTRARGLELGPKTAARIYTDTGEDERADAPDAKFAELMPSAEKQARLEAALLTMGYAKGTTLMTVVDPSGRHHGDSWSTRLPKALAFLLGPGR